MNARWLAAVGAAMVLSAGPALAQKVPENASEVARPGGTIAGGQKVALVKVADGFNDPVGVSVANDGSGRIFVVERVGRVKVVKGGKANAEPFLDLTNINPLGSDVQTGFVEQGLWSIAFHPKFKENGHFFVHYASLPFNGASMVVRFTVDPRSPDALSVEQTTKTAKVLMNIPQPYYNHYGGMIAFGPDGKLYVGKGDGGWEGDPLDAGQRLDTHLGKMLRLDVDTPDDVPYAVPKDNPFAKADRPQLMSLFGITEQGFAQIKIGVKPEIWAYGLRNPYMFHFDKTSGDLFIADVGQNHWEEINWQPAASKGGENYGWKLNQASHCHPATAPPDEVPDRRRPAGRRVSARGAVARRAEAQGRLRLLGAGAWRRELRRLRQGVSRRRLVLRPAVRRRLGQGRQQVADAGAAAGLAAVHGGPGRRGRHHPRDQLLLLLHRRQGADRESGRRALARRSGRQGPERRRGREGRREVGTERRRAAS